MKKTVLIALLSLAVVNIFAQQRRARKHDTKKQGTQTITQVKSDTLPQQRTVTVTSAFKPTLKAASKINFNAATPAPDTTTHMLQYDVLTQNIIFSYLSP